MPQPTNSPAAAVAAYLRSRGSDDAHAALVAASELSDQVVRPGIRAAAGVTEIAIMGEIGWEVTAQGVMLALQEAADADIVVRISSPGGSAFEGFAIYNMLARYPGNIQVVVESVAASAASFIAMAGDDVMMAPASFLMIHNAKGATFGDRKLHEATIAVLARVDAVMAGIFAARTGQTIDEVSALLDAETWMTAEEAVAGGFADRIESAEPEARAPLTPRATALIRAFARAPAAVMAMADAPPPAAPPAAPTPPPQSPEPPAVTHQETTTMPGSTTTTEPPAQTAPVATLAELQAIAARARLGSDWIVAQLVAKATADAAPGAGSVAPGATASMDTARAIVAAIATRGGVRAADMVASAAPYAGLSLRDMAAEFYEMRTGQRPRLAPDALFREVFASATAGMHTTSDFAQLLGDAIEAIVVDTAQQTSQEWRRIARIFNFDDFKNREVRGGWDTPNLEEVLEHEEIKYGAIARALGTLGLKTFAKGFSFSRQAIINNDLSQFTSDGAVYGAMAARSVSDRVWRLFQLGTTAVLMKDGNPWLHASHNNLAASSAAITEASLAAAEMALMAQAAVPGKPMGLTARYLIVGINRRREAMKLLSTEKLADNTVNTFYGQYTMIYEPSFPANAWALIADPTSHPVVAVSLLGGRETPMVDTEASFETYGLKVRVGLDYESAPIDTNGVYYNPGV